MKKLIPLVLVGFIFMGCGTYNNLKQTGPTKTDAVVWAELDQNSQLALPFGGTLLEINQSWYFCTVKPNGESRTVGQIQMYELDKKGGPMAGPMILMFYAGWLINFVATIAGDTISLPYTAPRTLLKCR